MSLLNRIGDGCPSVGGARICLCMIVKNEASIIKRCLESAKRHVNSWCIVDTGSTDGTQDAIREAMAGIPGALHERPWVDFAHNRNEARDLAGECDYLLVIDADEVIESDYSLRFMTLGPDVLQVDVLTQGSVRPRVLLIKSDYPGKWVGAIHEDLEPSGVWAYLPSVRVLSMTDGARAKNPNRHNEDLALLFKEIQRNPKNPRTWYYLGATYLAAGDLEQGKKALQMRMKFQGDCFERMYAEQALAEIERRLA